MGPTLGFDTKQRNSFLVKFGVFYNKSKILTKLFIVKYEKITLFDVFLVLLGPIISRFFACSNEEKNNKGCLLLSYLYALNTDQCLGWAYLHSHIERVDVWNPNLNELKSDGKRRRDVKGQPAAFVVRQGAEDGGAKDEANVAEGEEVGGPDLQLAHPVILGNRGVIKFAAIEVCNL
jgi:hypothetical protein